MSDSNPNWLLEHMPESVTAVFLAISAWFAQRGARLRGIGRRVSKLEQDRVTREDLELLRGRMEDAFTTGIERVERRTDEILLHLARDQR